MKEIHIIFLIIFVSQNLFSQEKIHPYNLAEKELMKKIEIYKNLDAIHFGDIKYSTSISEGNTTIYDSLRREVGVGGFSIYTFRTKDANKKLLKSIHNYTVHYKYDKKDSKGGNSERIEMTIFYDEKERPDLAKIKEFHYNNEEVLSSNLLYLNLPKSFKINESIYYSHSSVKDLVRYVFNQVERFINN